MFKGFVACFVLFLVLFPFNFPYFINGCFNDAAAIFTSAERAAGQGGAGGKAQVLDIADISFRWGLKKIKAPQAWEMTQGLDDIVVAVIDSGIDHSHISLAGRMWINQDEIPKNNMDDDNNGYIDDVYGWDFRDNDNDSLRGTSIHWHGTFVAGLIAANVDPSGIIGVAPQIKIMDLRFLSSNNYFWESDWDKFIEAVNYAVDNGADIINLSIYSYKTPPPDFHQAIKRAIEHGIIIIGIAGNNSSSVRYPGKYDEVIAVSAIDETDRLASYSNFGPEVEIAGPGTDVSSIVAGGGYGRSSGTSFAAAHLTGTIALLLSLHPDLSLAQLRDVLAHSSHDLGSPGRDEKFGYGLVNAANALNYLSLGP
jgi:subtilisin family serine protease